MVILIKKDVFIHVGLHKTGTTFLQDIIFKKIKNINFRRHVNFMNNISDGKNLFSDETLSVNPYDCKFHKALTPSSRFMIADRIKAVYPYAKILLGIRDKEDWKKSVYSGFVSSQGHISYNSFVKKYDLDSWTDFEGYIGYLKKLFSDVYVYRLEELEKDHKSFVKGICNFIDVDVPNYKNVVINGRITNNYAVRRKWFNFTTGAFEHVVKRMLDIN